MSISRKLLCILGLVSLASATVARAAEFESNPVVKRYFDFRHDNLKNKKVVMFPLTASFPYAKYMLSVLEQQAKWSGWDFSYVETAFNMEEQRKAFEKEIRSKNPADVIIVMNPDVKTMRKAISQAKKKGIMVVSVGLVSTEWSTGSVVPNEFRNGRIIAEDIVAQCGGKGKVAIVQGVLGASFSDEQYRGAMSVFSEKKGINVVASPAVNWDPKAAHSNAKTFLKQHKDLCAVYSVWDPLAHGIAEAIKEEGLKGKVKLYTRGGGHASLCKAIESGDIYKARAWSNFALSRNIATLTETLMQLKAQNIMTAKNKNGLVIEEYSFWMTKDTIAKRSHDMCWEDPSTTFAAAH